VKWRLFLSVHWPLVNANMAIESPVYEAAPRNTKDLWGKRVLVVLPRPFWRLLAAPLLTPIIADRCGNIIQAKGTPAGAGKTTKRCPTIPFVFLAPLQ